MHVMRRGSGEAILFLHGIPTSSRLWDGIIERICGEFTCVAVDLPGLGQSAGTPHGFRDLSGLAESMERLRVESGIERWHLVGHDGGCAVALQYAHQYPERVSRVALLTPSIFPDLKPFFLFEILRKRWLGELMAPVINLIFWQIAMRLALKRNQETGDSVRAFRAPFRGWSGARRLVALVRWGRPQDVLGPVPAMLPQLHAPTMIFHGADDPAVPAAFARRAAALIPNSRMVMLESGHFLPLNEPHSIAAEIRAFFNDGQMTQNVAVRRAAAAGAGRS